MCWRRPASTCGQVPGENPGGCGDVFFTSADRFVLALRLGATREGQEGRAADSERPGAGVMIERSAWAAVTAVVVVAIIVATAAVPARAASGEWIRPAGGTWWNSLNWTDAYVPRAADDEALFLDTVKSPAVIDVDGPAALGTFYLNNSEPLTFGGVGPLTVMSNADDAFIGVEAGSH